MSRLLADCEAVIFIAYTVPEDAEARGYSDWLVTVDNPFFNAIPGVRHYANWRVEQVTQGAVPPWDYFDFHGIATHEDLERVWFNPDLDAFRAEWLRLWGYGRGDAPAVLRHAYLMRPVARRAETVPGPAIKLRGGMGAVPGDLDADLVFRVDGVLKKHFAGTGPRPTDWLTSTQHDNPLGLDWLAVTYGAGVDTVPCTLTMHSKLIAEPPDI
jgi:hypothetical protein